jgi:hypothetical protein
LTSLSTPSSHLSLGLPLLLVPSSLALRILFAGRCWSIRRTWPAHFSLPTFIKVIMFMSLYRAYSSELYLILNSSLSFIGPYMALRIFLSKTARVFSSDLVNTQVSDAYVRTDLISVLYNRILFFHESICGMIIYRIYRINRAKIG